MLATVKFKFKGKEFKFEIDSEKLDLNHYEEIWDWWESTPEYDFEIVGNLGTFGSNKVPLDVTFIYIYEKDDNIPIYSKYDFDFI